MKLRTLIFWPHLIAGVVAGVVILLMSVTGVLLTYERQMIAWADSGYTSTPPAADATPLSMDALVARFREANPDLTPTTVTLKSDPEAAVTVAAGQRTLYVDRYSGAIVGETSRGGMRKFMSDMRAWHRWIAVEGEGRPIAKAITGWSNFLFLFIVVSGIYLWFPRKWTWAQVKHVVVFKRGVSGKARDFNWHNVIGSWCAVPLFIVVLSAMPISFGWFNNFVYRAVGEEPPAPAGGGGGREGGAGRQGGAPRVEGNAPRSEGAPARAEGGGRQGGARAEGARAEGAARAEGDARAEGGAPRGGGRENGESRAAAQPAALDPLWARAQAQVPGWRTVALRIPASPAAPVVFNIDKGDGGQPHLRSTLTLDARSGDIVTHETFADLTLGRRIRNTMRFAHTGEVLGIPGQTIAGIVSAGGAVLVWTGIALAWRRLRAWMGRRERQSSSSRVENAA